MFAKGYDTATRLTEPVIIASLTAGYIAAGRYLKTLTAAEVALCARHGFGLWLISEGMGNLATIEQGTPRGQHDGAAAKALAEALEAPDTAPIFAAVDFDAVGSQEIADVEAYMGGFARGCAPYPQGDYGDGDVVTSLPKSRGYIAGADGWAGTKAVLANPPPNLALVQHVTIMFAGISIDPVDILDESVLWFPSIGIRPDTA